MINKIIRGDCIKILKSMEENCVDIVFTDPPYNIKKKYDGYADNLSSEEYKDWMSVVINLSERISRRGVIFYVAGKHTKMFFDLMPKAHLVIVHKRAIGAMSGNYFLQYHSMFSTVKPINKTKDLWNDVRLPGEGYYFREPRYDTPGLTGLELTKKVIESFTTAGDLVLDPFMGTGTTAVACIELKRIYIGVEQSQKYCEIAEERIKETNNAQK